MKTKQAHICWYEITSSISADKKCFWNKEVVDKIAYFNSQPFSLLQLDIQLPFFTEGLLFSCWVFMATYPSLPLLQRQISTMLAINIGVKLYTAMVYFIILSLNLLFSVLRKLTHHSLCGPEKRASNFTHLQKIALHKYSRHIPRKVHTHIH